MNEAETRAEKIDPRLKTNGWGETSGSKVLREFPITLGRLQTNGSRGKPLMADYVLEYRGRKLAVIEAKSDELAVGEGVAQAKNYAEKMNTPFAFASNGNGIYQIDMRSGREGLVENYPAPDALWRAVFSEPNEWREKFDQVPLEDFQRTRIARYYQEVAVNKVMEAIADGRQRILLTLATGTGKTYIAFQIAWKLYQTRWNLARDSWRQPRVLFLADRNFLADQAFNAFSAFSEQARARIRPYEIRMRGRVPTNASVFFTIFQTFMSGENDSPYFGEYPRDFFDLVIIDECHRGGANDESNWRAIMEYFSPAVQIGLTATPRRDVNRNTYEYFGDPVYVYSLKEGINDGFLTPFKVKRIQTTLDEYVYTSDDTVIEGEVEEGKLYTEPDFNRIIEIKEREANRVKIYLSESNLNEKAIVFCANQEHAAAIRDLINQYKDNSHVNYCVRVTANDGALGEQYLWDFRDNEKSIPTILTTSQKLSTGVDALNIRNIVLMRPINSMVEFKQIIGRGTRLFEGKAYFTIYDYVDAYHHFFDEDWDGEPAEPVEPILADKKPEISEISPEEPEEDAYAPTVKVKIKLGDGREREIQHMISTVLMSADGNPVSIEEFLQAMYGSLPEFFRDEAELRRIWSQPATRRALLDRLSDAGYGRDVLSEIQKMISAEKSDLFDVLEYISFAVQPITREARVARAQKQIFDNLDNQQKAFLEFVLDKYIQTGVEELDEEKLPNLLKLKYQEIGDAIGKLGSVSSIREVFIGFQKNLYSES
jgi:type I restriction enzyme R subunit